MNRRDEGSVALWVVIAVVGLFAAVGLVVDGGNAMAIKGRAISDAYGAARAGAQKLDLASYATTGMVVLDQSAAQQAAMAYLRSAGAGDAVVTVAGDHVNVVVHLSSPDHLLDMFGLASIDVTGRGSATATYGVRGAGR